MNARGDVAGDIAKDLEDALVALEEIPDVSDAREAMEILKAMANDSVEMCALLERLVDGKANLAEARAYLAKYHGGSP